MKKSILSLLLLTVTITLSAAERSNAMMRRAAMRSLHASTATVTLSKPTLDVYNDGNQFAIVSRDDRFPAVLAYGMGNFDIEKAPDNVKWWFEAVQRSMDKAIKQNTPRRADVAYTPVAPMMTTKWGQDSPYNNMCPRESGDEHDTESPRSPSGCVATAMAQIMNYQQYPVILLQPMYNTRIIISRKQRVLLLFFAIADMLQICHILRMAVALL